MRNTCSILERLAPQVESVITGMRGSLQAVSVLLTVVVVSCEIPNCTLEGAV